MCDLPEEVVGCEDYITGETRACVVCDLPEEVVGCEDYSTVPYGCKKI